MLVDLTITEFLEKTASGTPAPGGGSVAALSGALAASLMEMVINLTIGKKGYEASEADMTRLSEETRNCKNRLIKDIDRDSEAYNDVMAAVKLPKATDDEKRLRREAVQNALKTAASVPLSVARDAFKILGCTDKVMEKGNKNALTDAAVAAMTAKAAVVSALFNVKINLASIRDEEFVRSLSQEAEELEAATKKKAEEILSRFQNFS